MTSIYARTYQAATTETSDPRQALLLLFDGAVRFLHQARAAMASGDHHGQCQGITRAQRILSTLRSALDPTHAPDLARSLADLYTWMHTSLTEASIRDDQALLDDVIASLTGIQEAWGRAYRQAIEEEQNATRQPQAA